MNKPDFYKIRPDLDGKHYPWPCESLPDRKIELFDDDILTKQRDGAGYTKHTGLCCLNISVPDEDLIAFQGWPAMSISGTPYYKAEPIVELGPVSAYNRQVQK